MLRFARRIQQTQQHPPPLPTKFERLLAATRDAPATHVRHASKGIFRIGPARTVVTHAQNRSTDFP